MKRSIGDILFISSRRESYRIVEIVGHNTKRHYYSYIVLKNGGYSFAIAEHGSFFEGSAVDIIAIHLSTKIDRLLYL